MTSLVFVTIIGTGLLLCLLRMLKGPSSADRAVAVDTAATVTTALLVLLGFVFGRYVYLDVALVYALLTFIGAVVIARYLEGGLQ
ncbi:MAG: monovalent cation/H+ antiporter complex subunit F [Candidatus Brocadiaceae bacterium]|jgi:multicomponent Na+:H+ antiporter subunit F